MFQEQCQGVNQVFNEQDIGLEWKNVLAGGGSSSTIIVSTTQERSKTSTVFTSTTEALSSTLDVKISTAPTTSTLTPTLSLTSQQPGDRPSPPEAPTSIASMAHSADSPPTTTPDSDSLSTYVPSHTHSSPFISSTRIASSHPQTHTQTKTIVAAAAGSTAFLVLLGALFYIVRRRAHQSRVAAEDRWDPSRKVSEYGSPILPNVDMRGGGGMYEKGVDEEGEGDGLDRYTRQGARASPLGYRERNMGSGMGVSELCSPTLSELASPLMEAPVVELYSPTFEARVAELGDSVERR
jgi:hypothetical protein